MSTQTVSVVIALFESRTAAEKAANVLVDAGFSRDTMSVIARDETNPTGGIPEIGPIPTVSGGVMDAAAGAGAGGLAGFVGGVIMLAIPGIGPLLAAGPLAAGLFGASAGVVAGGLFGALKNHSVPDADVSRMTEAIRRGRVLLSVHVPNEQSDRVAELLDDNGALDVDEPVERPADARQTGSDIQPLSDEAIASARLQPGEGLVDKMRERNRRSNIYPGFTGMGPSSTT